MSWLSASGVLNHGRLIGVVIGVSLAFAGGYQVAAWKYGQEIAETRVEHLDAVADAADQARKTEEIRRTLSDSIAANDALKNRRREVVERVVTKQVIKYVETDNARECGLSADGVRIHDTAARGAVPSDTDTTPIVDDGAIAASNAEVMQVVTGNYATCNAIRDQLTGFQSWVNTLQSAKH